MSTIKCICIDQALAFENTPVIASGGLGEDYISFAFCERWTGFARTAVFWRTEKEVYHAVLDGADTCMIPPEVTGEEGTIFFGVFGVNGDGVQRTTQVLTYHIVKGAITTGTKPSQPTQDIYNQLLAQYAQLKTMTFAAVNVGVSAQTAQALGLAQADPTVDDALLALHENGGAGKAEGAVLYQPQALTEEQQAQARQNIGAAAYTAQMDGGCILYDTVQDLAATQKARARSNIGAVSAAEVTAAINTALGYYVDALEELDDVIGGVD